jgi:hypothetical protein
MRDRHAICSTPRMRFAFASFVAIGSIVACSSTETITPDPSSYEVAATPLPHDAVATPPPAAAPPIDASTEAAAPCTARFACAADGMSRAKCATVEPCARGCLRNVPPADDECMGTTTTWSCPGSYGTKKAENGDYYLTAFGCWVDAAGTAHGDSGDNCIPSCLAQAKAAGLCNTGDTGKQCEQRVIWYTADAARFGCLARVRITNPANGKSVVAVALDYGPSCSRVEDTVSKAVLDASGRVDRALFGADQGVSDRSLVHVVEVDPSTPLGM